MAPLVLSAIENSSIVAASDDHDLETARQLTESAVRFIQHLDGKAEDDAIKLTRLMETLGEPVFLCVLLLQRTVFSNPQSYFHHYKDLPPEEAVAVAREIWSSINLLNLRENILPTRERANVVLRKRADHTVGEVWLREI